jgi:hypothetical protein
MFIKYEIILLVNIIFFTNQYFILISKHFLIDLLHIYTAIFNNNENYSKNEIQILT